MRDKQNKFGIISSTTEIQNNDFASVYYYLLAGIALLVAVFLFLPRISVG